MKPTITRAATAPACTGRGAWTLLDDLHGTPRGRYEGAARRTGMRP